MKKILKNPRYFLPAFFLPSILVFFYIYKSSFSATEAEKQPVDSLQGKVAAVSDKVRKEPLSSKLEAMNNRAKQSDGYTGIARLDIENMSADKTQSGYSERDKVRLDSIEKDLKRRISGSRQNVYAAPLSQRNSYNTDFQKDRKLADALSKISASKNFQHQEVQRKETDPMQLFRAQMALVDSMSKANDPAFRAEQKRNKSVSDLVASQAKTNAVPVSKVIASVNGFNTVRREPEHSFIGAMIDEELTVHVGNRLRIALLDDIMAGSVLIKKGTYLYAEVSGFTGQRVNLSVRNIMQLGQILSVTLDVYDQDGLKGLYVPASAFREFSRDLSVSGVQGVSINAQAENSNQLVMSMVQKMFSSSTAALSRLIRGNKARIKYSTMVYLIDPSTIKKS